MILKAAAKVNLYLNVLGSRKDGYHEIESIIQSVTLYDRIILKREKKKIRVFSNQLGVPQGEKNICYRAAELFLRKTGIKEGIILEIQKSIPLQAGLGGGSADAAATLWGMNKLFETKVSLSELLKWGEVLGADVPFCLRGGTYLVKGKGEILIPLPSIKRGWLILLYPKIPISTCWVYKKATSFSSSPRKRLNIDLFVKETKKKGLIGTETFLYNGLEEIVFREFPSVKMIKEELLKAGARGSLMTGSGSTVFGIIEDKRDGERIKSKFQERGEIFLVQTVDKSFKEEEGD
ncbi:4-(cytidine 5'-diphospho)-2-C-methyl-D-erythritol kinase [Candidatus Aerophobetes bacterium]|nr:4-(cytidine 5'-diphospho)-2-C-methyl-D-erythritol kinase [Candidatus Aerophobetes bacterium]